MLPLRHIQCECLYTFVERKAKSYKRKVPFRAGEMAEYKRLAEQVEDQSPDLQHPFRCRAGMVAGLRSQHTGGDGAPKQVEWLVRPVQL